MASLAELVVSIVADTSKFDKGLSDTRKELSKAQAGANSTTTALRNLVSGVAVAALVTKIGQIANATIEAASEAEETQAKFETAFRGIEDQAEGTAEALASAYGLATNQSKQLLGNTGDLLKGFGATATEALDFSLEIQKLAVDLASYNNVQGGATRVSNILTKSVLGNKDGLSELGVSLLDVDIKQELVRTGQEKLTGQAGKLAKAQATFNLILQQTEDAQGDAIRTQESYANVSRRAQAASQDLRVELGRSLLPTATVVKGIFGELVGELASYIRKINDLRDAEKALEAGEATFDQRILLLEEQKKGVDEVLTVQRTFAEAEKRQYGEISPLVQQRLRELEAQSAGIGRQIDGIRVQIKEEEELKKVEAEREAENEKQRQAEGEAERIRQENYKASIKLIGDVIDASKSDIEVIDEQIVALQNLQVKDADTNTKRIDAINLLQEERDRIISDNLKAEEEAKEKLEDLDEEYQQKVFEQSASRLELLEQERLQTIEKAESLGQETTAIEAFYAEEKKTIEQELAEERITLAQEVADEQQRLREETLTSITEWSDNVLGIFENIKQVEINNAESAKDSKLEALERQELGEEEYAEAKEEIERQSALEIWKLQKEQYEIKKANDIVSATINGAVAFTRALAELGPVAGPIAAGVLAGLTATQVAVIATQPPPPRPQFAEGGVAVGATSAIVGEDRGEVMFGMGASGAPMFKEFIDRTVDGLKGSGQTIININSMYPPRRQDLDRLARDLYTSNVKENKRRGIT